jgi:hypothetical protein
MHPAVFEALVHTFSAVCSFQQQWVTGSSQLTGDVTADTLHFATPAKGVPENLAVVSVQKKQLTIPNAHTLWPPNLTSGLPFQQVRVAVVPMKRSSLLCWAATKVCQDPSARRLSRLHFVVLLC